jgi:hypothetical protein
MARYGFFLFLNDSIFYSSIFILSAQLRNIKYGNNIDNTNKYIKSIRCRLNNRNIDYVHLWTTCQK